MSVPISELEVGKSYLSVGGVVRRITKFKFDSRVGPSNPENALVLFIIVADSSDIPCGPVSAAFFSFIYAEELYTGAQHQEGDAS